MTTTRMTLSLVTGKVCQPTAADLVCRLGGEVVAGGEWMDRSVFQIGGCRRGAEEVATSHGLPDLPVTVADSGTTMLLLATIA
jgi:hypothetical protein